jgi:hypothetical protein
MPQLGFKSTIQVFERAKTFHASDRAATVIDATAGGELKDCILVGFVGLFLLLPLGA